MAHSPYFCGPFPGSCYLLVVVDAFTRFPEYEIITSTSAEITISKHERIFATHGLPKYVKTDNGPPFPCVQFYKFMKELGANHTTSSPYWPQGNAEVERFMQPLVKAIKTAHVEGKEWKLSIYKYLLNYRATSHATTGKSPAELLFNRQITTKLPNLVKDTASVPLKEKDSQSKEKVELYVDQKHHFRESDLYEDDIVEGYDEIPASLIIDGAEELAVPLSYLINQSLAHSAFPTAEKCAKITPVHKSDEKVVMDNYRPISVLPVLSKVLS